MPSRMSSSRPAALIRGASANPRSAATARAGSRPAARHSAFTPAHARPARMRSQSCRDKHAIVGIERNEIGDSAERDEIEQRREIRFGGPMRREAALSPQARAQREHQAEHDADARDRLARKCIAGDIRIHDRIRGGQSRRGQMMIGDDHAHAERARRFDAGMTRDAVVDRDDEIGRFVAQFVDETRRKSVTVSKTIRHAIHDVARSEHAQRAHRNRRTGGAIRVEIADDADATVGRDRVDQQRAGPIEAVERRRIGQLRQLRLKRIARLHAARGINTREHRMHPSRPRERHRTRSCDAGS